MLNDLNDIKKRNETFSYEDFFSEKYDHVAGMSASGIITDKQAITILNNQRSNVGGFDYHAATLFSILKATYNLKESNFISITNKQKIVEKYSESIITLIIIGGNYGKIILVTMPNKITNNQLALLELYRDKYDDIIKQIEEQTGKDIIAFNCKRYNSFDEIIEYAKGIVSDDVLIPEDKHIIGNININDINSPNRSK